MSEEEIVVSGRVDVGVVILERRKAIRSLNGI